MDTQNRGNPIRNVSQGGGASIPFSGGDERSEPKNADYRLGQQERDGDNPQRGEAQSDSTTAPPYQQPILSSAHGTGPGRCGPPGVPYRPFLVLKIITALKGETGKVNAFGLPEEKPSSPFDGG